MCNTYLPVINVCYHWDHLYVYFKINNAFLQCHYYLNQDTLLAAHFFARIMLIWTTHKINDMMSLETNYIYIFKYFISSKSIGILLLYIENMQEDIIAVFPLKWLFHYFVLYICIKDREVWIKWQRFRLERGILILWYKYVVL